MKRIFFPLITGTFLLYILQAASWMLLPIHEGSHKFTHSQDKIMNVLSAELKDPGMYFMPDIDPSVPQKDQEQHYNSMLGKPWAAVYYHSDYEGMTAGRLVRGFILDIIAVFVIVWLLVKCANVFPTIASKLGVISLLVLFLLAEGKADEWNWWMMPFDSYKGEIVDVIFTWGITGLFLAWIINKKTKSSNS